MKTAQSMLVGRAGLIAAVLLACFSLAAGLTACSASKKPDALPMLLSSPYGGKTEIVLAVAPLLNESGVSIVDELAVTDALVNELQQVQGVSALPVNRTLAGMRALKLPRIDSVTQARALAKAVGADGLVVGTITAWHPYDPPILGLNVALFGRSPLLRGPADPFVDPAAMQSSRTEPGAAPNPAALGPLSAISRTYDASSGETRQRIKIYAEGRHDPQTALGWKRYTSSMGLYTKFACYEIARELLDAEKSRLEALAAGGDLQGPP